MYDELQDILLEDIGQQTPAKLQKAINNSVEKYITDCSNPQQICIQHMGIGTWVSIDSPAVHDAVNLFLKTLVNIRN